MKQEKSPGLRLREAREAQGKSLSDMAKLTRIGLQQLEGIERDTYDRIPAAIYVKGFVKNYAQKLGLDPVPLVEQVEKILSGDDGEAVEEEPEKVRVPKPVSDEEPVPAPAPVPRPSLKPPVSLKVRNILPTDLGERLNQLKQSVMNVRLPVDRRLGLIVGTVLVVLLLVFGARSCGGNRENTATEAKVPVEQLENLLIATPEPILFELPRTTP